MPLANHQLNQERQLHLLQSQLDGHKLRADELERLSERLTADLDNVKERHSAAGHRQFQVTLTPKSVGKQSRPRVVAISLHEASRGS